MKSQHTQGEWQIGLTDHAAPHTNIIVRNEDGTFYTICELRYANNLHRLEEANAKLIAEAPNLLKELDINRRLFANMIDSFTNKAKSVEDLLDWLDTIKNALNANEKAIKKATS